MKSTGFYRAFEERYRGSRELISQRLETYLPFIQPLLSIYQPANAIDLGCGRGEWIELVQDAGFLPQGVDFDVDMLAACTERGLPAVEGDAIAYLKSLGDRTQCIVSGFHVAEHISFSDLETLVAHALRVLKPGGLLILETPNPENLVVGTSSFFLDPTHLRPLPPPLLSFLPEHYGFARVRTLRLQESAELRSRTDIHMMDVLGGVSPDYAVVAQKAASPDVMASFDAAFAAPFGIELREIADRYDSTLARRMAEMHQRIANVEDGVVAAIGHLDEWQSRRDIGTQVVRAQVDGVQRETETAFTWQRATEVDVLARLHERRVAEAEGVLQVIQSRLTQMEREMATAQMQLNALNQSNRHYWHLADDRHQKLLSVYRSLSWRLTSPLRFVGGWILQKKAFSQDAVSEVQAQSEFSPSETKQPPPVPQRVSIVKWGIARLLKNATLVALVHAILKPFPKLHGYAIRQVNQAVNIPVHPARFGRGANGSGPRAVLQIFLDVTCLINADKLGDVQGVVKNLLIELISSPPAGFFIRPVFANPGEQGYRHAGERIAQLYGIGEAAVGIIAPQRGDIFLGLDLQPTLVTQNAQYLDAIRLAGVRVYFVIYNLLNAGHPRYFPPEIFSLREKWLQVISKADGVLCISQAVADDYSAWVRENLPERLQSIEVHNFSLGDDLLSVPADMFRSDGDPVPHGIARISWAQSARQLVECVLPVAGQYLSWSIDGKDGPVTVADVLLGIRRELVAYQGGPQ